MIEDTRTWLRRLNVSEDAVEEINAAIFKLVQSAGRQEAEIARMRELLKKCLTIILNGKIQKI